VKHWVNTRVRLNDNWGTGAAHTLSTPTGKQAEFLLRPRYLRDTTGNPQLAHFQIDFPSGYLADGWQGITFTPMGQKPVTGISGLPQWDASQRQKYRDAIAAAEGSLSNSHTERLEAVIPYLAEDGKLGYNTVRLFYVSDATRSKPKDLVIIRIATHTPIAGTVQARQDGSGHGPPD
jgi:hypothetical protein